MYNLTQKNHPFRASPEMSGHLFGSELPALELLSSTVSPPIATVNTWICHLKVKKNQMFSLLFCFLWQIKSMFKQHQWSWDLEIILLIWSMRSYDLGPFQDLDWILIFGCLHLLDYLQINQFLCVYRTIFYGNHNLNGSNYKHGLKYLNMSDLLIHQLIF